MSITFIGSGNLAWHLAPSLDNTDYPVREVYSKNQKHASALVSHLYQAEVMDSLDFSESKSGLFIIATSDDAIAEIAQEIVLPEKAILVHTSGSQPLEILNYAATDRIGVFYPLQTFTANRKIDFNEVPIFIESNDSDTEWVLTTIARALSKKAIRITSEDRRALHTAAVFASNFTNHMLTLAKEILDNNRLDFEWMKPLITETLNKSLSIGPDKAQTGPARRGDVETLDKQMAFLEQDVKVSEIYKLISQHILDRYES